jgi:peroxiredoxin
VKQVQTLILNFRMLWLLLLMLFSGCLVTQTMAAKLPESKPEKAKLSVYIFLAETCPISQFYTLTLKDLYRQFDSDKLTFKGIFPNTESTVESVAEFKKTYDLPFELIVDTGQKLTRELKATITPEVVIKNDATGEILYQGRIDDSYYQVGKKRPSAREHDLRNALTQVHNNQPVKKNKTEAVGCYITFLP